MCGSADNPCRGRYRIPRRRRRQPSGGHQHMILSNFAKNCMKLRKFWAMGGEALESPPPKSATALYPFLSAMSRCARISVQYGRASYNRHPYANLWDRSKWTYTKGVRAKIKCDAAYTLHGPTFAYCTEGLCKQLPTCNLSNKYYILFELSILCCCTFYLISMLCIITG